MRIRQIEIANFRGIEALRWSPSAGLNCLIGAGDTTKTTVLDAIELALNPRGYTFADDSDFYNLDVEKPVTITVSIGALPGEFLAENKYGLHLRGWDNETAKLHDEPAEGLEYILSIRVVIDKSLEARWSLYNERIAQAEGDPPMIRYKDMQTLATTRLGPYAERHLGWGRQSVLTRLDDTGENASLRLAEASRAARQAFKAGDREIFQATAGKAEELGRKFSVPVREAYSADLDVQSVSINTGGIALHDGKLPLRRLGTGSSRLLISALQHDVASDSHIALIDEVEHGLEPHRIARLLQYLKSPRGEDNPRPAAQTFLSTHSPVVIRELTAQDLHTVISTGGEISVKSVSAAAADASKVQGHLRASPEAFLARRVLVGEGKTECGLARGLDAFWTQGGQESFAFLGVVPIVGGGKDGAPEIAETLLDLGYEAALLLDSDEQPNEETLKRAKAKGGFVVQWEGDCSTEERLFLDLPWQTVTDLVRYAQECFGDDAILAHIKIACADAELEPLADLSLPSSLDTEPFRRVLGKAAKRKKADWYKDITRAERAAAIVAPSLTAIPAKPLAEGISRIRQWVDGKP